MSIKYGWVTGFSIILFFSCQQKVSKQQVIKGDDYVKQVLFERQKKNDAFSFSEGSPFENLRADFAGLKYFSVDTSYRVYGTLRKNETNLKIAVRATNGEERKMEYAGEILFVLKKQSYSLPVFFQDSAKKDFFIMFHDLTNGESTYQGGRFLETEAKESGIILDFNKAYNPYCHYNHLYSCPIVPKESNIPLKVEAGEKKYIVN
jgi:uncharacterized protein